MRFEILDSIPSNERAFWRKSKWDVYVQLSNGTEELLYDHVQHVDRDRILASLTLEGSGKIAKIPEPDISSMDCKEIFEKADQMEGHTYQAAAGELMIINGVHYAGGGLHAAPKNGSVIPERLTILVSLEHPMASASL